MADTGTGTDPATDRCPSCGHLDGTDCGCSCCGLNLGLSFGVLYLMSLMHDYWAGKPLGTLAREVIHGLQ